MKLEPFEKYVGEDDVVSYVGIRGDEDRDGYVSSRPNIQTVFPFRRNIWSLDVINKFLHNDNLSQLIDIYNELYPEGDLKGRINGFSRETYNQTVLLLKEVKCLVGF